MSDVLGKTLGSLQSFFASTGLSSPSPYQGSHHGQGATVRGRGLTRGFHLFLDRLCHCHNIHEEQEVVKHELNILQEKMNEPGVKTALMCDYLTRVLYCEMLGYRAGFAYIHAVKLAQQGSLMEKRMGYLAASMFLQETHELVLLLVNTILRDLQSNNILEIGFALTAVCYLIPAEMAPAVLPLVQAKSKHPKEYVRKKAVQALHHFIRKCPHMLPHLVPHVRAALGDKDPSVMAAALQVLEDISQDTPSAFRDLLPGLIKIQQQVLHRKLPNDYVYHSVPGPWIQMSIIRLFRILCKGDTESAELVVPMLIETLVQAQVNQNIAYAVIYECILTAADIKCGVELLQLALVCNSQFLQSRNNNLRHTGLAGLEALFRSSTRFLTAEQQEEALSCLSHPDDSIRRKTLSLLYTMASAENVDVICGKILEYLNTVHDEYLLTELVQKVMDLADRFSPSLDWYICTLLRLMPKSDDDGRKQLAQKIKTGFMKDEPEEEGLKTVKLKILAMFKQLVQLSNAPSEVLELYVWAEGYCLQLQDEPNFTSVLHDIVQIGYRRLSACNHHPSGASHVILMVLSTILNAVVHSGVSLEDTKQFVLECANTDNFHIKNRAVELLRIIPYIGRIKAVMMKGHSKEQFDFTLSFLDNFVISDLENGGKPYHPYVWNSVSGLNRRQNQEEILPKLHLHPYEQIFSPTGMTSSESAGVRSESVSSGGTHNSDIENTIKIWSHRGRNTMVEAKSEVVEDDNPSSPSPFILTKQDTTDRLSLNQDDKFPQGGDLVTRLLAAAEVQETSKEVMAGSLTSSRTTMTPEVTEGVITEQVTDHLEKLLEEGFSGGSHRLTDESSK